MKKSIVVIILTAILVFLILWSAIVFANNPKQEEKLQDKITEEISYLDHYLISLLGEFNGLTIGNYLKPESSSDLQTDTKQENLKNVAQENQTNATSENRQTNILSSQGKYTANWSSIQKQVEELYQTWNTISFDLYSMNVDKTAILSFGDILNTGTQNVKKKEKEKSMETIMKLYQLLPQYSQAYSPDSKETNILKIQSNIVTAYVEASCGKWEEAQKQLSEGSKQFTNLLNSVNQNFQNQTTVNQCYILIHELNKAASLKDKEIFFIEYQNLMGKMEII